MGDLEQLGFSLLQATVALARDTRSGLASCPSLRNSSGRAATHCALQCWPLLLEERKFGGGGTLKINVLVQKLQLPLLLVTHYPDPFAWSCPVTNTPESIRSHIPKPKGMQETAPLPIAARK